MRCRVKIKVAVGRVEIRQWDGQEWGARAQEKEAHGASTSQLQPADRWSGKEEWQVGPGDSGVRGRAVGPLQQDEHWCGAQVQVLCEALELSLLPGHPAADGTLRETP